MNLWARILRQLTVASVALFFFSCEDETSLLGFKNPNEKFRVAYVDIPLNSSTVVAIDSLVTDLRPIYDPQSQQTMGVDGLLVGQYQDPYLGNIRAESFLTIYPTINNELQATAVYDSITVQFRLNFYAYGFTGSQRKTINIHQITGDTLSLYGGRSYYASSPAPQYSVEPLGQAVVDVHFDSLSKQATIVPTQQDTILATARLSDDFGTRIFEAVRAGFTSSEQHRIFKAQIKGLALLPGEEPGVLGMNVMNREGQLSQVVLHYHTLDASGAVDDTLRRTFGAELASFSRIEADRSTTELAALPLYQGAELASGLRYVQSGAPLITKLDLKTFYDFADTVDNILINSAELVINNVGSSGGTPPHASIALRLMNNESDQFLNTRIALDRERVSPYFVSAILGEPYFYAAAQDPAQGGATGPAMLRYDTEANRFSTFMTIFAQSLFTNKDDDDGISENRLRYLALYPQRPAAGRSVTRTVFSKEDVKLRIFYTRANTVTP